MNRKYRLHLLTIGWVFTILGVIQMTFLVLSYTNVQMLLTDLANYSTKPLDGEVLAATLSDIITVVMHVLMPIWTLISLVFGVLILRAIKRGEQGVAGYAPQVARPQNADVHRERRR